jgi:GMP synthase-like glutamine amidotransferase
MRLIKCLEIGMTQITTLKENPLFSGNFKAYSLHSYCIASSGDFEVWAKSAKCIQIIKHKIKPIYGMLFHPEVRNQEMLKRFIEQKQ